VVGGESGRVVVEPPGEVGGIGRLVEEASAGGGDGEDARCRAEEVHQLQGCGGGPLGQGAATRVGDACRGEGVSVEGREDVLVDVDPVRRCTHTAAPVSAAMRAAAS
jgi:hypothetical protein